MIENKTKTHICRYIPKSLIEISYAAKATYPISIKRLKQAISTCLLRFRCAYAFKHRTITEMVTALGNSNKFTQFHRKASTTINYYIDKNDEKLLDKLFHHGINFLFD